MKECRQDISNPQKHWQASTRESHHRKQLSTARRKYSKKTLFITMDPLKLDVPSISSLIEDCCDHVSKVIFPPELSFFLKAIRAPVIRYVEIYYQFGIISVTVHAFTTKEGKHHEKLIYRKDGEVTASTTFSLPVGTLSSDSVYSKDTISLEVKFGDESTYVVADLWGTGSITRQAP